MKYFGLLVSPFLVAALVLYWPFQSEAIPSESTDSKSFQNEDVKSPVPNDHWYRVRSYPDGFNEELYLEQLEVVKQHAWASSQTRSVVLDNSWVQEGPGNIGGRFNCLAMSPTDQNIIYAGAANGGIFKTIDGGANWTPIFDDFAYLAIGEIQLDPNDENTVFVGTGDRDFGGGSHLGNGIYKSTDGGMNWTHLGLEEGSIITQIQIDPTNSDRIFASTLGNPYEKTMERGVYRSTDGGLNWQNVLFISDSSGVIDLEMDPTNPDVLYAAGFNRINLPYNARVTGPDAKIFKTIDGGDTWTQLAGGLPTTEESRIGLEIDPTNSNIIYALYVDGSTLNPEAIYKSSDAGNSWSPLTISPDVENSMGGFGWYFGEIHVNPYNSSHLMVPGVEMFHSLDGGSTWSQNVPDWWTYEVHADKHDVLFLDNDSYIIATDGGLYRTDDNGISWTDIENIPVTQFYHIDVDPSGSGIYGGGAQDNGCMSGNELSLNNWSRLYGGDGFRMKFLELDPGSYYFESQNGGLNYNGSIDLSPDLMGNDRVNWDMPYFINEVNSELFIGTSVIKMMAFAPWDVYVDISTDLTRVPMGNAIGQDRYHTITEIDQPIYDEDRIYCGTSDGLVWRGDRTGGEYDWTWTNITGTLPDRYVTSVRCSPNNDSVVFVGMSGYRFNEDVSYLYKSEDAGQTWVDVSSDLPGIVVNDICIIPGYDDQFLFAALDGGVYFSENGGTNWSYVGLDMPFVTVTQLEIDFENEKLIAGTYSRSMYSYDISWISNLQDPASIEDHEITNIKVYPNPAHDLVYLEGITTENLNLYDVNGTLVFHQKINYTGNYGQVNIRALPAGVYFFHDGERIGKIIKQ